jgi:uncharacterized membrane protein
MAQGTPMLSIFNSKAISAEILHTFVGCIGLVLVCPLTSLISAWLYKRVPSRSQAEQKERYPQEALSTR